MFAALAFNNMLFNDWVQVIQSTLIGEITQLVTNYPGLLGIPLRPYYRPQSNAELPVITYDIRKRQHTEKLSGSAGQVILWLHFQCWSYTYGLADQLATNLQACLDDSIGVYDGITIEVLLHESDMHRTYHDGINLPWLYCIEQTFRIVYLEELPNELTDDIDQPPQMIRHSAK